MLISSCDRTFRDPEVFTEHNKSHTNVNGTTFTCVECMAMFESRGRLNGHMVGYLIILKSSTNY